MPTVTSPSLTTAGPRRRDGRRTVRLVLLGVAALIAVAMGAATVYIALYCKQPVPGWPETREWSLGVALALCLGAVLLRRKD